MKVISAGIFLIKKDRSLLVCHPTNHKKDSWSIPKGKIEDGESFYECAIRETYEETNLLLSNRPSLNVYELDPVEYKNKKKILHPFLLLERIDSIIDWNEFELKCNSNVPIERGGFPEMDDYKWVSLGDAHFILHDTQVACLDKIQEILNTYY